MEGSGPPPLFRFENIRDTNFFLCRLCRNHLALMQEFVQKYVQNNKQYGIFAYLVNVEPDPDYFITNNKTTVRSTYCRKCKTDLGFHLVEVKEETDDVKQGRFLIYMNKLLLWRDKELLNPETDQPLFQVDADMIDFFKNLQLRH